jgi:hypothetical protein
MIIYMATNIKNGKRYIGATKRALKVRRSKHYSDAKGKRRGCHVFNAAIRKYGEDAFEWTIISTAENYTDLMKEEIRLIALLRPEYNITRGGQGMVGLVRTKEWLEKTSRALKGRKPSPQCYAANNHEHKFRSIVCLNDGLLFKSIKSAADNYGISKRGIGEMLHGRQIQCGGKSFAYSDLVLSKDEIDRQLSALNDRRAGWEARRNKDKCRPVVCITDSKEYSSVTLAASAYEIEKMRVIQICQRGGETNSGLSFRYADREAVKKKVWTEDEIASQKREVLAALSRGQKKIKKPIVCLDTGHQFDSISNAARAYDLPMGSLFAAIDRGHRCAGLTFQRISK